MRAQIAGPLGVLLVAAMLQLSNQAELLNSSDDICRLFKDGTKLRKPGGCNASIVCKDHKSVDDATCTGTKQYFNLGKGSCQSSTDSWDNYCSSPCTKTSQGYIGSTLNCANWYYCEKATLKGSGVCDHGMYFDQLKQMCVYPADTTCSAKFELCQVVPTGVLIKDENSCNLFLSCKKGVLTPEACEHDKYFDADTSSCIKKSLVPCEKYPVPANVCGTSKLALRNMFASDEHTCRGYYYCRDLGSGVPDKDPAWQQCDLEYFFDAEHQRCVKRENLKCVEDRCDGIESGRTIAEVPGCQHYLECLNGIESSPFKCEDDMYFDVTTQECTTEVKRYGACTA